MKSLTVRLAVVCFTLAATAFAHDFDALHYRVEIVIPEQGSEIRGVTTIELAALGATARLPLDFTGMTIDAIDVDGAAASHTRNADTLTIALPHETHDGERLEVAIRYHGSPADGLVIRKNKYGHDTFFADNWPDRAHAWFPSIDRPGDKATAEVIVTAPDRYDVVANGARIASISQQNGMRRTEWREREPIPPYCIVAGVSEFAILDVGRWSGVDLSLWAYPKDREAIERGFARAPAIVDSFTSLFGPFSYEKLALVESSTRFGGMENASAIFFDEKLFDGEDRTSIAAHEIAHQWFGDAVTESEWRDLWLSEGFATYFASVFFERADGVETFRTRMIAARDRYLKVYGAAPPPVHDSSITDLFALLNRNNYEKGAWVLHMLRRQMGDAKFFSAIRDYYASYRNGVASTDDFRHVVERHAGRPLGWFFEQWLDEPGLPRLEIAHSWNAKTKRLDLRITQTQKSPVFTFPLDLDIDGKRVTIDVSERVTTQSIAADAAPAHVVADPDSWLFAVIR
ncbi:MAG TPA: M1 family metallopeptidase [Thermoanaerobaculia bacterium]|nr:M1 family metallopeptidase [Thermoanaerobaculia bacterium]